MRKTSSSRSCRNRKKVRKPSFIWRWLMAKGNGHIRLLVGVTLAIVYIYLFYTFLVAPFSVRWRGLFGEADYPSGYSIRGIDISHHQGVIIWDKLRWAKIGDEPLSFVIMKATEGETLVDRQFAYNFVRAHEYGYIRGAYHFFVPGIPAKLQAKNFLSKAKLEPGDLPPILDIELKGKLSPEQLRADVLEWMDIMEKHFGVVPILYTNYTFKENYLGTPEFDKYPYWIAHYYVKDLRYQGKWKFWQHTDKGSLPGIRGDVDLNLFNGSMYSLRTLTIPDTLDNMSE